MDSPYFDGCYFDGSYFDASVCVAPAPSQGSLPPHSRPRRRIAPNPLNALLLDDEEALLVLEFLDD